MTSTPALASRSWTSCAAAARPRADGAERSCPPRARRTGRRGQGPHRCLALHVDVVLVVVDLEDRLGRVDDAPDDDRGDLDRVAVVVVHLELLLSKFRTLSETRRRRVNGLTHHSPGVLTVPL